MVIVKPNAMMVLRIRVNAGRPPPTKKKKQQLDPWTSPSAVTQYKPKPVTKSGWASSRRGNCLDVSATCGWAEEVLHVSLRVFSAMGSEGRNREQSGHLRELQLCSPLLASLWKTAFYKTHFSCFVILFLIKTNNPSLWAFAVYCARLLWNMM